MAQRWQHSSLVLIGSDNCLGGENHAKLVSYERPNSLKTVQSTVVVFFLISQKKAHVAVSTVQVSFLALSILTFL